MTLSIPSEYEAVLHQVVANGAFATPEEALRRALQLLAEEHASKADVASDSVLSKEDRLKRAQRFLESTDREPPARHFVDDSRESIY